MQNSSYNPAREWEREREEAGEREREKAKMNEVSKHT